MNDVLKLAWDIASPVMGADLLVFFRSEGETLHPELAQASAAARPEAGKLLNSPELLSALKKRGSKSGFLERLPSFPDWNWHMVLFFDEGGGLLLSGVKPAPLEAAKQLRLGVGVSALVQALATWQALERRMRLHQRKLEKLAAFEKEIFAVFKEKDLGPLVMERGSELLNTKATGFLALNAAEKRLELVAGSGKFDLAPFAEAYQNGMLEKLLEKRQPAVFNGLQENKELPGLPRPLLIAPVLHGKEVEGALVFQRLPNDPFTPTDVELSNLFSQTASQALANARTFENLENAYRSISVAQERLVQSERLLALKEMAGGLAHDFNNVLGTVLGRVQLLLTQPLDERVVRSLNQIESAAQGAARTVARLQEFTRARQEGREETVALDAIAREAVELTKSLWRDRIESGGGPIELTLDASSAPILGNFPELVDVVTNLISNATDALPSGGKISLATFQREGNAFLTVRDNGVGMSDEVKSKAFFPFFTTKGKRGTGLGLSVAYGVVSRHRGEIVLSSEEGKGTLITLRFPAVELVEKHPETPRPVERHVGAISILVVDDDENIRNVLSEMLTFLGHRVTSAQDGEEAFRELAREDFNLVITDLGMPGVSGWEVARRVKLKNASTPVMLISGWGSQIDPKRIAETGVDLVLNKPFQLEDVRVAIGEILSGASGRKVHR